MHENNTTAKSTIRLSQCSTALRGRGQFHLLIPLGQHPLQGHGKYLFLTLVPKAVLEPFFYLKMANNSFFIIIFENLVLWVIFRAFLLYNIIIVSLSQNISGWTFPGHQGKKVRWRKLNFQKSSTGNELGDRGKISHTQLKRNEPISQFLRFDGFWRHFLPFKCQIFHHNLFVCLF